MKFNSMHSILCEKESKFLQYQRALVETACFYELVESLSSELMEDILTEGIWDSVKDKALGSASSAKKMMGKMGLGIHKSNPGLIEMMWKSGKQMTKVMITAFKAMKGGQEEKDELKQVIKDSKIKKEEIIHFLLQLDTATAHIISGPIHLIDAVTGWHIWGNIQHKAKEVCNHAQDAYKSLTALLSTMTGKAEAKLKGFIDKIMQFFQTDTSCSIPT